MPEVEMVARRGVPGTSLHASAIGVQLEPSVLGPPTSDDRVAAILRRARSRGITTFDVGFGPSSHRAERLLAKAFPTPDPELLILVSRSSGDLAAERSARRSAPREPSLEAALERSIQESAVRLGGQSVGLIEWRSSSDVEGRPDEPFEVLSRLSANGTCGGWLRAVEPGESLAEVPEHRGPSPPLFSGSLSLLDRGILVPLSQRNSLEPLGFFARDPFGQGKLDGTRFARTLADRRPDARPLNVRELQREFDPVLRLGFLTGGTRRSLAQASLRFVLRWPWVCSAIVPLPTPERLDDLLAAESTPELTDAEVGRLLELSP